MNRFIRLVDLTNVLTPDHAKFTLGQMTAGRAALERRNLRYDNKTGILRDSNGVLERLSNPADHLPLDTEQQVMDWHFSRYIKNAASRLARGLSA